jgi:GAF domain-containing protein
MTTEQEWARDKDEFVVDVRSASPDDPVDAHNGGSAGPLGRQFATLTRSLLDARTVDDVLQQVTHTTAAIMPQVDVVGMTLRGPDGRLHTPAETDEVAVKLDELQTALAEGPCWDAANPEGPAMTKWADLRVDPPWRQWAPAAVALGVRSVVSTALMPDGASGDAAGAFNVFSGSPHGLDDVDHDALLLLATHASLALANVDAVTRAELQKVQLERAVDSRDVIGQAKGIIMYRRGVSADEAFDVLRRASQDLNVRLVELARTLATRHTELDLP